MMNVNALKGALSEIELPEPKPEQLMAKLMKLQQGKKSMEQEVRDLMSTSESLQVELSSLQSEAYQVEELHKEKEELSGMLQFQCEESERESARLLNQNKTSAEVLEQLRCEIQEFKLKQRKERMRFENQLHQLMEQHKNLYSVFSPERLPEALASAENKKQQLLSAEQVKLAQLHKLGQEVEELKTQKTSEAGAAETQEE